MPPLIDSAIKHRNLLEKKDPSEVSLEEAKEAIRTCVRTLFYRDCRSTSRFSMAVVNTEGAAVEKPKRGVRACTPSGRSLTTK